MLLAEYSRHEGSGYRVWTEDATYAAFKVVSEEGLQIIVQAFHLLGGCCRPVDDADCAPIKHGIIGLKCPWCDQ